MRIAILGATSQIAKDLILSFSTQQSHDMVLFGRQPEVVTEWIANVGLPPRHIAAAYTEFHAEEYFDAVLNFVGVGDPARAAAMGSTILDVTLQYDQMALDYVQRHPACRYIFLSSGAAYGIGFERPVNENTNAVLAINNFQPQDWYAASKLYAECRHRALSDLAIVDVRIFNYFSRSQDISARFLITDMLRAAWRGEMLVTSPENIVRDYLGPDDFSKLISLILSAMPVNDVVDCYTCAPVDKMQLLSAMRDRFGLKYTIGETSQGINATGFKMNYFSENRKAANFGFSPSKTSLESVLHEALLIKNRFDISH